ncbi:MAG TPA: phosphopantothenoylcysteine decarboxylase [Chthoniobacterales bacterium]|nr:phosphopantothenoylcysteine decarboxylase [Chthoniobacterales bacterium]
MRFLITAGPTREPIDPVRYISNRSSGKMGYAIAEAAIEAGHEVVLISGPASLDPPNGATLVSVATSDEMFDAVHLHVRHCDILVMCAAVADYRPAKASKQKIKKSEAKAVLELIPTRDILASFATKDRNFVVVGFAAETEDTEANALKKLREKNCDVIVANDARMAMESDENEVTILFRDAEKKTISRAPKKIVARELIKIFENVCEKCLTKKIT